MISRYVCGITLYHPDNVIYDRILLYSHVFEMVYVFDNTEKNEINQELIEKIVSIPKVIYIGTGKNVGLSRAFNTIIGRLQNDVDYLCTLDQDSKYPEEEIKKMFALIEQLDRDRIAVVGPYIIYDRREYEQRKICIKKRYVITSGSFINVKLLRHNNILYDENYFIDKFEVDLCQQFIQLGYEIIQYQGAVLYQRLGEEGKNGHANHSALRHYYLFRNRFYFNHKFYVLPKRLILNMLQTMKHIYQIALYEEKKMRKMGQLFYAYLDYKNGKMGKREE